jgi:hypothetical protein
MGVTVDFDKVDDLAAAVMQNDTVAALCAADAAASRRWAAAREAANQVWGKPQADFDAAHDALDAAFAAVSVTSQAAANATRREAQRLVTRDNLRALHAQRAAV